MVIVSDTSVISNLLIVDCIDLLPGLFREIIIPQSVYRELQQFSAFDITDTLQASWLTVRTALAQDEVVTLRATLDAGEAEAIVLAKELTADLLIIDETKGRQVAATNNIPVTGLLGILLRAKAKGLISLVKPVVNKLEDEANFFISQNVRKKVLTLANE